MRPNTRQRFPLDESRRQGLLGFVAILLAALVTVAVVAIIIL